VRAALLLLLASCTSSYQSARALPVGKMQVTTAATRGEVSDMDDSAWVGDVQARTGLTEGIDGGVRLVRTVSAGKTSSGLGLDSKIELTPVGAKATFSAALSVALMWDEDGTHFEAPVVAFTPTLFFGTDISPEVELVLSTKFAKLIPNYGEGQTLYGTSVGLRIGDEHKSWAIQPEVTYLETTGMDGHVILFGVGLSAGN
jgi:hypothetical protein